MKKRSTRIAGAMSLAVFGMLFICYLCMTNERPQTMYVTADVCKVRAGAGEDFDTIGLLAKEDPVIVLDTTAGKDAQTWYKINPSSLPEDLDISNEECYIRSDLLTQK